MDWDCNDYVERAKVLEITAETGALETQGRVKALPAANVRPVVHGEWEHYGDFYECSLCHKRVKEIFPGCPYCFAVMH